MTWLCHQSLQNNFVTFFQLFSDNQLNSAIDECHFLKSKNEPGIIKIDNAIISSTSRKLLRVKEDCNLNLMNAYIAR